MTSVLLVDDQALVRMGFRMVLEAEDDLEVVGEAGDGAVAVRQVAALDPDVVVMDVRMPGVDGIEATARVVAEHPRSRVLVLTTFDVDDHAFAALRAGASGFLLKSAEPAQLVDAVRTVAAGSSVVAPRLVRRMLDLFADRLPTAGGGDGDGDGGGARDDGAVPPALRGLTPRELEVMRCVARGLSNAEIAELLVLSTTTVKTHVGSLLAKLGLRDRVQVVIAAYENGVVTRDA
ncbi:response regulator transcription factor [Pseudokineococcus marinus]|uniref:Response regulator transcription factor n=1 Tax=Pseudokineococcus marinus TaxID=351215 RepID=A0A849BTZ7_9ACTN|nr:response regulator transcription factor [Pseudokineococcus marinus]NNH24427.1 response regulator transcription factor [Pseudokineococcus marinus]